MPQCNVVSLSCMPTGICVPQDRELLQYGISTATIESAVNPLFRLLTRFTGAAFCITALNFSSISDDYACGDGAPSNFMFTTSTEFCKRTGKQSG
jgi:hypothetical protein